MSMWRSWRMSGSKGTANLNDIWRGEVIDRTIRLCFWRVPSTEIPQTAEGRVELARRAVGTG